MLLFQLLIPTISVKNLKSASFRISFLIITGQKALSFSLTRNRLRKMPDFTGRTGVSGDLTRKPVS